MAHPVGGSGATVKTLATCIEQTTTNTQIRPAWGHQVDVKQNACGIGLTGVHAFSLGLVKRLRSRKSLGRPRESPRIIFDLRGEDVKIDRYITGLGLCL